MGTSSSKLEKSLPSTFPDTERLFGLENVMRLPPQQHAPGRLCTLLGVISAACILRERPVFHPLWHVSSLSPSLASRGGCIPLTCHCGRSLTPRRSSSSPHEQTTPPALDLRSSVIIHTICAACSTWHGTCVLKNLPGRIAVWEYMLLQLGAAGTVFLHTVSRGGRPASKPFESATAQHCMLQSWHGVCCFACCILGGARAGAPAGAQSMYAACSRVNPPPHLLTLQAVLNWARTAGKDKIDEDSMLVSLADAFVAISSHKKKFGVYGPKRLIQVLARRECHASRENPSFFEKFLRGSWEAHKHHPPPLTPPSWR